MPAIGIPVYKHTGIIRSLRVSMGENVSMVYTVGNDISKAALKIHSIIEDAHDNVVFGIKRYNVFITKWDNPNRAILWKSYDNMPCVVEYDINHVPESEN